MSYSALTASKILLRISFSKTRSLLSSISELPKSLLHTYQYWYFLAYCCVFKSFDKDRDFKSFVSSKKHNMFPAIVFLLLFCILYIIILIYYENTFVWRYYF